MWGVLRFVTPLLDLYVYCLIHQSVVVFCLVFLRKSAPQFFSNVHVSFVFHGRIAAQFFVFVNFCNFHVCFVFHYVQFFVFFNFSNVHVCFALCHDQFFVFVNFSNAHVVLRHKITVQCFCICWVEWNFFSLTVFDGNLLAGDVHSSVTIDRHVQAWQWIGCIYLLTWGLLWPSAC